MDLSSISGRVRDARRRVESPTVAFDRTQLLLRLKRRMTAHALAFGLSITPLPRHAPPVVAIEQAGLRRDAGGLVRKLLCLPRGGSAIN